MDGAVTKRLTLIAGYSGQALEKGVGRIRTGFNRVRSAAVGVGRAIGRALRTPLGMLGLGGGIYGLIRAFTGLMGASTKQEEIFRKLQSAVELTGLNYADVKGQIDSYFASIQKTTRYGDTDMAPVLQMITQLTGSLSKGFEGAKIAADMTAAGLFDLSTSAKYVAMAMAGEVTMLGRYIPELKVTYGLITSNMTATEKWAIAKELLNRKLGGMAAKDLNTFAGMMQSLKNYLGDIKERFGDIIAQKLTPKLAEWRDAIIDFIENGKLEEWAETTEEALVSLGKIAKNVVGEFGELGRVIAAVKKSTSDFPKNLGELNLGLSGVSDRLGYIYDKLKRMSPVVAILNQVIKPFREGSIKEDWNWFLNKLVDINVQMGLMERKKIPPPSAFFGPMPLFGPGAPPKEVPPPGVGIPAVPEMDLELKLRTAKNQQIEELEYVHQENFTQILLDAEQGRLELRLMYAKITEGQLTKAEQDRLSIFMVGQRKFAQLLEVGIKGEMKMRNALGGAVIQSVAAMVAESLRVRAREWLVTAGAYLLIGNFVQAARYGAGAALLQAGAGGLEFYAERATGGHSPGYGESGGVGGGYEAGGAGTRTQYGTTVSAERMEMHISPSVSIIGDIIVIGDIGVEELKATLGQVSVESVQDALETGEIDVQKAVR